jgi:hypothetical protein
MHGYCRLELIAVAPLAAGREDFGKSRAVIGQTREEGSSASSETSFEDFRGSRRELRRFSPPHRHIILGSCGL